MKEGTAALWTTEVVRVFRAWHERFGVVEVRKAFSAQKYGSSYLDYACAHVRFAPKIPSQLRR